MPSQLRSKIPEVQELLDQGKTHAQISEATGVSTRTVSRWLKEGWLRRPSPAPVVAAGADAPESAPEENWTARTLVGMGIDPATTEAILRMLEYTDTASNERFREWQSSYIPLAATIPDEWAAAISFLPILGRDICNPALETLAELMHESVPWEDGKLRNRYARLAKPLLLDAIAQLRRWLLFVSDPEQLAGLPAGEAAVASEVLKRCPHVDRPVRRRRPVHKDDRTRGLHLVREMPMGALALSWSRFLEEDPPWRGKYGDYKRELQLATVEGKDAQDGCEERTVTLVLGRSNRLKWPRWAHS